MSDTNVVLIVTQALDKLRHRSILTTIGDAENAVRAFSFNDRAGVLTVYRGDRIVAAFDSQTVKSLTIVSRAELDEEMARQIGPVDEEDMIGDGAGEAEPFDRPTGEYYVISAMTAYDLADRVNSYCQQGYAPYGAVAVYLDPPGSPGGKATPVLLQAVFRPNRSL